MVIEFPCDVQLITVRPLNDSPNQRLMILHRAGIYCGGTATTPCRSGDLSVIFDVIAYNFIEIYLFFYISN